MKTYDYNAYADELAKLIQECINDPEGSAEEILFIRELWDKDSWESIVEKFQTEGSTWIVWWYDGVRAYIRKDESDIESPESDPLGTISEYE